MEIKKFVELNKITMQSENVLANKNMPDWASARHYKAVFKYGKRQMTTYFSMGLGLIDAPTVEDVLDCLASDSAGVENARDFADWCNDYAYNQYDKKAEKTYKVCVRLAEKLETLLGEGLYNELLWETERL